MTLVALNANNYTAQPMVESGGVCIWRLMSACQFFFFFGASGMNLAPAAVKIFPDLICIIQNFYEVVVLLRFTKIMLQ